MVLGSFLDCLGKVLAIHSLMHSVCIRSVNVPSGRL